MRPAASNKTNAKDTTMNTSPNPPVRGAQHPLMILAALAVLLFCLVGIAAIMGWIPSSIGGNAANRPLSEADRAALAASMPGPGEPAAGLAQGQALAPGHAAAPAAAPEPRNAAPSKKSTQVAAAEPAGNWCANCGNVESVRTITQRAEGSGLGAAGGAVLGGLLGNQVGGGSGRQLATVAGAVGGAVVGNQVEGNMKATTSYEIRVRLDDGTLRTFRQSSPPGWRNGDRVRIVKGRLRAAA
jgi:outer membrane lipoprotein SlyB